jgi:hypothetical protein
MASRISHINISSPESKEISWLKSLGEKHHSRFSSEQLLRIKRIINHFELPCKLDTEAERTRLRIYSQTAETDSPYERPIPLLTIRDSQIPNGDQPHPHLDTLGRAQLIRLAFNHANETRCIKAGIHPGSLRPESLYPKR